MRKVTLLSMIVILAVLLAGCAKGDETPPVISGVSASDITETTATVSWTTDEAATSQVEYGLTASYGSATLLDSTLVTSHSVLLSDLDADTTYHYRVKSKDASGNEAVSEDCIFTTATLPNEPPNRPSNVSPADGASDVGLIPTLISSAFSDPDAGDTHAASQWQITTTSGDYSSPVFDSGTDTTNLTSITIPAGTLDSATTYYWRVRHQDNQGDWSDYSMETSFSTCAVCTLLTNLEYPKGLWVEGDKVYLTETAQRNTGYGGKLCLDQYNVVTGEKTVLVNNPQNSDAVVVASDGKIYLTSYQGSVPGESGSVSVVDPETNIETHLLDIEIASEDMFIDSEDNILIIGSSDAPDAKSIYLLPAEDYTNPIVLKTGLGRTWCVSKSGSYIYFSDHWRIGRFSNSGSVETFVTKSVMAMSFSSHYLYYADWSAGTIGRINLATGSDETIISGLHGPRNVRYDESSGKLYFLEEGTDEAQYKDGTLKVVQVEQAVTFPDANLEAAVREAIGKPTGSIYDSDLEGLTSLNASNRNITDLTGLEYCTNLWVLRLSYNQIIGITPLDNLTSLTNLDLYGNQISNILPLANLTSLGILNLGRNQISNISPLSNLTSLVELYLWSNQISDLSPLANLTSLRILGLYGNQISDLSPLADLANLTNLFLQDNQISDLSPLQNLTSLTELNLSSNQISDLSLLADITSLTYLYLGSNQISDLSPLSGLTSLTELNLSGNNQISDLSPLSGLTSLAKLYLWSNQISDISPLSGLTSLTWLGLGDNQISNVSALSGLTSLTGLDLSYNQISDVSPLSGLTSLTELYLNNNQIADITPLVDNSGLGEGDTIDLRGNPLSAESLSTLIPQLEARGVEVLYDAG
jgi:internalin A